MKHVALVNWFGLACNLMLGIVLCLALATVIQERSVDIVRITVPYERVLPTAQAMQGVTGKVAYAYPVTPDEKTWRVVIDRRSEDT